MPTTLTEVDLWNIALDHVSELPLATTADDNVYARFLQRQYPNARDIEIRQNTWNFAVKYHELAEDGTEPEFRWKHRYALPPQWLRLLPPTYMGIRGAPPVKHEVVGGFVYTDATAPLRVRVLERITNPGEWDPLFADAMAAKLAIKMALRFTGKASYLELAKDAYAQAYTSAMEIDAFEGTPEPQEASDVINVRYQ